MDKLELLKKRLYENRFKNLCEEATKQSFIIPFLEYIGYDVFNTTEVLPEYTAGESNSEAVDYALCYKGDPELFLEAKKHHVNLVKHIDQLERYMKSDNKVKIGILSNGSHYIFFRKKENSDDMEKQPFYCFNISRLSENDFEFINLWKKTRFSKKYIESFRSDIDKEEINLLTSKIDKLWM